MSRSGYSEDLDMWDLIRWRGAVKSALRGKRGQACPHGTRFEVQSMMRTLPRLKPFAAQALDAVLCILTFAGVAFGYALLMGWRP